VALPGNEGTARVFSAASLLLIDEASRVRNDVQGAASHAGGGRGGLVAEEDAVGQRGFFYETWDVVSTGISGRVHGQRDGDVRRDLVERALDDGVDGLNYRDCERNNRKTIGQ
jgi:hypothetical protein